MKASFIYILLLVALIGCKKELTIDEIEPENVQDILKPNFDYSLTGYITGIEYASFPLPGDKSAKDMVSLSPPWSFYKDQTATGFFVVTAHITDGQHLSLYFAGDTDRLVMGSFLYLPPDKFKSCLDKLLKSGYVYKESFQKYIDDILIKKFNDECFLIVDVKQYDNGSGYLKFHLNSRK